MTTKVIYRKFSNGEVIAIFPDEPWDRRGNLASYMHIGQHGDCSPDYPTFTTPATPAEYAPLHDELVNVIGYDDLKIVQRRPARKG